MIAPLLGTIMRCYEVWWGPDHERILWLAMLSLADDRGVVNASIPGLARMATLTVERAEEAILALTEAGLVTKELDGGRYHWQLHQLAPIRALNTREAGAKRQAAKRARERANG